MERITIARLEGLCETLNELTGSPMTYSDKQPDGRFKANIGHYHISQAYGGVELCRTMSHGGGVNCPLGSGHGPKRELYEQMRAMINGIEIAKEL